MSKESEEKEFQEIVRETMDIEKFKEIVGMFKKSKTAIEDIYGGFSEVRSGIEPL